MAINPYMSRHKQTKACPLPDAVRFASAAESAARPAASPFRLMRLAVRPIRFSPESAPGLGRRPRPEGIVYFAIDSIAAKPVKPCDGDILGALNLLSLL